MALHRFTVFVFGIKGQKNRQKYCFLAITKALVGLCLIYPAFVFSQTITTKALPPPNSCTLIWTVNCEECASPLVMDCGIAKGYIKKNAQIRSVDILFYAISPDQKAVKHSVKIENFKFHPSYSEEKFIEVQKELAEARWPGSLIVDWDISYNLNIFYETTLYADINAKVPVDLRAGTEVIPVTFGQEVSPVPYIQLMFSDHQLWKERYYYCAILPEKCKDYTENYQKLVEGIFSQAYKQSGLTLKIALGDNQVREITVTPSREATATPIEETKEAFTFDSILYDDSYYYGHNSGYNTAKALLEAIPLTFRSKKACKRKSYIKNLYETEQERHGKVIEFEMGGERLKALGLEGIEGLKGKYYFEIDSMSELNYIRECYPEEENIVRKDPNTGNADSVCWAGYTKQALWFTNSDQKICFMEAKCLIDRKEKPEHSLLACKVDDETGLCPNATQCLKDPDVSIRGIKVGGNSEFAKIPNK